VGCIKNRARYYSPKLGRADAVVADGVTKANSGPVGARAAILTHFRAK
jgi:hypothetical protein